MDHIIQTLKKNLANPCNCNCHLENAPLCKHQNCCPEAWHYEGQKEKLGDQKELQLRAALQFGSDRIAEIFMLKRRLLQWKLLAQLQIREKRRIDRGMKARIAELEAEIKTIKGMAVCTLSDYRRSIASRDELLRKCWEIMDKIKGGIYPASDLWLEILPHSNDQERKG